jgi:hypothetical protein
MIRLANILYFLFFLVFSGYSQVDEIWSEANVSNKKDSTSLRQNYTVEQVEQFVRSRTSEPGEYILGGSISNIFHESVDSVKIVIRIDGGITDSLIADNGLFCISIPAKGSLIDLSLSHPDYHEKDTTILFVGADTIVMFLFLEPKYKILLRGRVYAGNMPLEGVDVTIQHASNLYNLVTKGCFYDKERYWNCLFDGMFKLNLTTEDPTDSIYITLTRKGMRPYKTGMIFSEYTGEIMDLKMKYESILPNVSYNSVNFKLSLPVLSLDDDWFVSFSYYRLLNNNRLRRIAYGIEANTYITTVSVTHNTFRGLEPSRSDSSYIDAFVGPSVLFWFIAPEKRFFSTYGGCTFSYNINKPALVFQPFVGSRLFIDLNKAISLELRYCEYKTDIVHYSFNPYGRASRYTVEDTFDKLNANLGIQIVF